MNREEQDRMAKLLQAALPPMESRADPAHDLWPAVLHRLHEKPSAPWFDWALAAALIALVAFFPAAIPVLLYYL